MFCARFYRKKKPEHIDRKDDGASTEKPPHKEQNQTIQPALLSRLPLEIRLLIWEEVLGGHVFHMNATSWGLKCFLCRAFASDRCPEATYAKGAVCHGSYREPCFFRGPAPLPPFRALSLLGTCRQIYNEAVELLYAKNTFNIDYLDTLKRMIEVAPERLRHIKRVHVTTALWKIWSEDLTRPSENAFVAWENIWRLMATAFTGLQWLRLDLYGTYATRKLDEESMKPLLQIRKLKHFHLEVWRDATPAAPQGRDLATSLPLQAFIRNRICADASTDSRKIEA